MASLHGPLPAAVDSQIRKHNLLNVSNPGYIAMSHSDVLVRGPGEPMAVNVSMQCLEMALRP